MTAVTLKEMDIRAIVFDLDGTLYMSEPFEKAIWESVSRYAAELLGTDPDEAGRQLRTVRQRLSEERGSAQTLAVTIQFMGGTMQEMHRHFAEDLDPEHLIQPDTRVKPLIEKLGKLYTCWLLTNNNQRLTARILSHLDLEQSFKRVITINESWRPKPDQEILDKILSELGEPPAQVLFVGDRYDIDLHLPEQMGCPVLLTKTVDELMQLEMLIQ